MNDVHSRRIIDDFLRSESEPFSDIHTLNMLLLYRLPCHKANELSHALMDKFISLSGVIDAPPGMLREVTGVDMDTAAFIKIVGSAIKRYFMSLTSGNGVINSPADAKEFMSGRFLGSTSERLWVAGTGYNGKVIFCKKMSDGSPHMTEVIVSSVIKSALRADAVKVILAHNHPHGFCSPSPVDISTTRVLDDMLKRVDVELFDHIIVASDGVKSMREMGIIGTKLFSCANR